MTKFADCSIVIPNYNGAHLLRRNLPSVLMESDRYPGDCQIILVDDASRDRSAEIISLEFPDVVLVQHERNQGFAKAVHSGISAAANELILLLNSDVSLLPGCIESLQHHFTDEETFAVSPLILDENGNVNEVSWPLSRFVRGHLKLIRSRGISAGILEGDPDESGSKAGNKLMTPYCSGGAAMLRRSKFRALGGFCAIYEPFYYEDFDIGLRAWYRGWPCYFAPGARVVHVEKSTIGSSFRSDYIKSIWRRNRYFLEWIHFPASRLLISTLPFTLLQVAGELALLKRAKLKGLCLAIIQIKDVIRARRETKKDRVYNLRDVLEFTSRQVQ